MALELVIITMSKSFTNVKSMLEVIKRDIQFEVIPDFLTSLAIKARNKLQDGLNTIAAKDNVKAPQLEFEDLGANPIRVKSVFIAYSEPSSGITVRIANEFMDEFGRFCTDHLGDKHKIVALFIDGSA